MWTWVVMAYLVMLVALVGCAGYVALTVTDERRAERAYRVLKMTIAAISGSAGVLVLVLRLHELGVLR